ncbi:hypothetical protein EDC04DRAFT_2891606 [Pisolithus marmoratus]|nr:hypothetical protein EDC04DRAFT_2891606 [Pisolithus marmoratus]
MSLCSSPNILDDATHEMLDKEVHEGVGPQFRNKPLEQRGMPDYIFLLRFIVEFSNGTLDPKYFDFRVARALIASQPQLVTMLDAAWSSGSYRDIRNLGQHDPFLGPSANPFSVRNTSTTWAVDYGRVYTSAYYGKAVDGFCEYLEHNNKMFTYGPHGGPPKYYAKLCSIVQSSGTGKSRLLVELHRKGIVVLYMCLRPSHDKTALPPRDDVPADILTPYWGIDTVDYGTRCCAFFAATFMMVREWLSTSRSLEDALRQWNISMRNLLSPIRQDFFAALKAQYETCYREINTSVRKDAVAETDDESSNLTLFGEQVKVPMEKDNYLMEHEAAARMPGQQLMINAYQDLVNLLDNLFGVLEPHKAKFVIALDEAHPLNVTSSGGYRLLTILSRVISKYSAADRSSNHSVWVVFASTTLKVADFAAPQAYYDSAKVFADGQLPYPPYCALGWDQLADPLEGIAATDVARADHIIGYGRAMWKSIQEVYDVEEMMGIAISKLFGTSANKDLPLVIWSQRCCLEVTLGHHEAIRFVESGVASYLRICIATTDDRNCIFTTYLSESFLSCAAASLLHTDRNLDTFLKTLEGKILNGMVDVGKSGELASRLLWLLAKDLYVRRAPLVGSVVRAEDRQPWQSELIDCQLISVIDYFRFVFGKNFWEVAGEKVPGTGKKAKEVFNNAFVNFSHWVRMDGHISASKNDVDHDQLDGNEWTLRHWHRTSAVQCCYNQPLVDKMIPIYFKDNDENPLPDNHLRKDLSCMSQIFISDKAQRSSNEADLQNIARTHDSINCNSPQPWIAILVDLGMSDSVVRFTFPVGQSDRESPIEGGPCLRIYAAAINVDTFPFLSRSERLPLTLQNIISWEENPPTGKIAQFLQEQVKYGSTSTGRNMRWEGWAKTHN